MEWKSGMKVRCIEEYAAFSKGDIVTLIEREKHNTGWIIAKDNHWYINDSYKKYWEVVDMEFTKDDLKVGMLVELKNGRTYILLETREGYFVFVGTLGNYREDLNYYNEKLENKYHSDFDIVKVWGLPSNFIGCGKNISNTEIRELLWERKEEVKELTMEDLEREYGCKVKIVK